MSWAKVGRGDEKNTFLFSVDFKRKFYKQKEEMYIPFGTKTPAFGNSSLRFGQSDPMNECNWWCSTNGSSDDDFVIPNDDEGNSLLTGSGKG